MSRKKLIISIVVIVVLVALIAVLAVLLINKMNENDKKDPQGSRTLVVSGVNLYVQNPDVFVAGDALDYSRLVMEYSVNQDVYSDGSYVESKTDERLPLTAEMLADGNGIFTLEPAQGTVLEAGDVTLTLYFTPPQQSEDTFSTTAVLPVEAPDSSVPVVSEPESEPEPEPPPEFAAAASVTVSKKTATVTFKTDVESTINAIVATSGDAISTGTFYDYFNRNIAYAPAVAKKTTYTVTSEGRSESYELPDLTKAYYLLVNAVENKTGTWQKSVTVVLLYSPASNAPGITKGPSAAASAAEGTVAFEMQTGVPATVYTLVTAKSAEAPTAKQVKEAGSGYGSESFGGSTVATNSDKEPFNAQISVSMAGLAAGEYTVWAVAQSTLSSEAPLSEPVRFDFTVS